MEQELLLPGTEDATAQKEPGLSRFVSVEVRTARTVNGASRAASVTPPTPLPDDVAEDDIVELEFEKDGKTWKQWTTVEELRKTVESQPTRDGRFIVPRTWVAKDASRGVGAIALKALKIFGIDTQDRFAEKGAQVLAAAIAEKFESEIEKQGHPFGLYKYNNPARINARDRLPTLDDVKKLPGDGPYLVFIHGTASSSTGSFGKLIADEDLKELLAREEEEKKAAAEKSKSSATDWQPKPLTDDDLKRSKDWNQLLKKYGDRILALEHRTFSVSPIQNALDLANLLPQGARLHLVSHSRGGLVGDLICLAQASSDPKDFDKIFDKLTAAFLTKSGDDKELKAAREKQRQDLKTLWGTLRKQEIKVERFVRVACPAHGTTLASKRMDYLASGLLNAVGRIPIIDANPLLDIGYDWLKSLLLTLVKKKADPSALPGIEAMVPDSPLIEFLNHQELTTDADLGVIAGDIEVGDLKLSIPALVGNAFFWAQNDLVVNTKSMAEGIRRAKAFRFFDQGATVCHFNYFFNDKTRTKLTEWLLRADDEMVENFLEVQRVARSTRGGDQAEVHWLEAEDPLPPPYTFQVGMLHGDLRYAAHPVAVGHYNDDGIISAEKIIDGLLGEPLSRRHEMRLYPGPVGTSEVILAPPGSPIKGTLVIGLGDVGDINMEAVRQSVSAAALRFALAVLERSSKGKKQPANGKPVSAAFSSLLIGTYGGHALSIKDAVSAIIQGTLHANEILRERGLKDHVWIDRLQLVELYEDVAIEALHALHDLAKEPPLDFIGKVEIKVNPPLLQSRDGGRYQRPPSDFDAYWWRRIQITGAKKASCGGATNLPALKLKPELQNAELKYIEALLSDAAQSPEKLKLAASYLHPFLFPQPQKEDDCDGGLEFLVLTDRARAEGALQAMEKRKVDWLVKTAMRDTNCDKDLAVVLYELLVPNTLKEQAEHVVLVVDREAARYPWELMTERSRLDKPLVTRIGLLRQFKTTDYRPNPQPSRGQNALVVGDPANTGLIELLGAQQEALAVTQKLKTARYDVRPVIKQGSEAILKELFAREYQIVHIAAHGIFNPEQPDQSGIVLEDGQLLTTKEITNLRTVPDLVFINCCFLGEMEQQIVVSTEYPHRLAASVAEELIKMGVRAVVAAGWAVDDSAATKFAEEFYQKMLTGECFGNAVLHARAVTYDKYPGTNTWGAYQCYGNPGFRLRTWTGVKGDGKPELYSHREYRDALKSIAQMADVGRPSRNRWLRERLQEMRADISAKELENKLLDGEMLAEFGDAWHALGDFDQAITYYRAAVAKEDSKISLKAVEKLSNFECRHAEKLWLREQKGKATDTSKKATGPFNPTDLLDDAERRINWLLDLNKGQNTPEQLALKGRIYKARAILAGKDKDARLKHLRTAKGFYEQGHKENKAPKTYQLANLIACRVLLGERRGLDDLLKSYKQMASKESEQGSDFWAKVALPDFTLLQHLVKGDLPQRQSSLLKSYQEAFDAGPKLSEADSVLTQMDFLAAMMGEDTAPAGIEAAAVIQKLRDELGKPLNAAAGK